MFFSNLLKSGWIHALFMALIAYPLGAITAKIIASMIQYNSLVYTSLFYIGASIALLIASGPGPLSIKTLKNPYTWLYAIFQIFIIIFGINLMKYVSATEGAGLYRVTGVFTLILSGLFLSQKIRRFEYLGMAFIFIGFYLIIFGSSISVGDKLILVFLVLGRSIIQGSKKIITEVHPTNIKAKNIKDEFRVTGFIMSVSGTLLFIFLLLMAYIKSLYPISALKAFPNYADFLDLKGFLVACLMGICILSIQKYCEFYSGKTIGAKYMATIVSLQIIVVFFAEKILVSYNLINPVDYTSKELFAIGIILLGNLTISISGFFKDLSFIKKGQKQGVLVKMEGNLK